MTKHNPAEIWHKVANTDAATIASVLHENCVFESPVVHKPQRGKAITTAYLASASQVLGNENFRYINEWHNVQEGDNSAILEFETELDGIKINGIDMITCDDDGLITHFKVMIRPLKAVNMVHQKMGEMLAKMKG
jgi:SnoaL-like domain